MNHPERVSDYLEHILEAISRVFDYLGPLESVGDFLRDQRTQDAVVRNLEIVGEAANKIAAADPALIAKHPAIPWNFMRGIRNVMIHQYFAVDQIVVWNTAKQDLPALRNQIEDLLAQERDRAGK